MHRRSLHGLGGFGVLALGLGFAASLAFGQAKSLVSVRTDQAPAIDGAADAVWAKAAEYKMLLDKTPYEPSNGYKGAKKSTVTMKSLYDAENIYFLVQWDDPTQSNERAPWVKQADGSWKQLSNKDSTGHDNTYYEDKMAVLWNVNTKDFDAKGCAIVCHKARGGKIAGIEDKSPARKYTNAPGETVDMWHWKGVRTGPVGQVDDQYMDGTKDPKANADWGRKSDVKTGGGYADNVNAAKNGPAFMNKGADAPKYWILAENKADFVDTFKAGDVVPGIVVAPFTGPRADIAATAVWKGGKWTLEMQRKLVTTGEKSDVQDVQFKDLKKSYSFGVAVFDNSQINHLFQEGAHKLTFK